MITSDQRVKQELQISTCRFMLSKKNCLQLENNFLPAVPDKQVSVSDQSSPILIRPLVSVQPLNSRLAAVFLILQMKTTTFHHSSDDCALEIS